MDPSDSAGSTDPAKPKQQPDPPSEKAEGSTAPHFDYDTSRNMHDVTPIRHTAPEDAAVDPTEPNGRIELHADDLPVPEELGVAEPSTSGSGPEVRERIKTLLIGKARDLTDQRVFQHVSLVAFLAWVGLGADGLSSSSYGPAESFHNLMHNGQDHTYLAVFLAIATLGTVLVISACYSHIIDEFPSGGGGYLVASKLLGSRLGLISGCALLVDYVMTITVSIAAAGDALFGLMRSSSLDWGGDIMSWKLTAEIIAIVGLIVLNMRGIKESVIVMLPIFITFLITHTIVILGAIALHIYDLGSVAEMVREGVDQNLHDPNVGLFGMIGLLLYAYSFGAGSYTGIEAVSNSMSVMAEPRVANGKRTMLYMAISLSLMAGGLIVSYLLLGIKPKPDITMNQVLTERFARDAGMGVGMLAGVFILVTIVSEGALLISAAQAGFIGGPRILANMAQDLWMPHWFAHLSERLTTHNGILLMGISALAALIYTDGNIAALLIMYSINVFLTFSLSMVGMCSYWWKNRSNPMRGRRLALFGIGAVMCLTILGITVFEKFTEGGWMTLAITGALVIVCLLVRRYYAGVSARLSALNETLGRLSVPSSPPNLEEPVAAQPTAAVLVGGYSGLGIHTTLNAIRFAPGHFKNLVFLSAAVVDTGNFKGSEAVDQLKKHTENALEQYVDLAQHLGFPSMSFMSIGTDGVDELEHLCLAISKRFPKVIFFAGQLIFRKDTWYQRILHNQTAYALQRRLQWAGVSMVILPTRVR